MKKLRRTILKTYFILFFLAVTLLFSCKKQEAAPQPTTKSIKTKPVAQTVPDPKQIKAKGLVWDTPWKSAKIGGGGWIQNVVLCPSDPKRAYAYVDIAGIFRSDDRGKNWQMIHFGLPHREVRGVLVDPRNADHLIAAIGRKKNKDRALYISDDGGKSWGKVYDAQFIGNCTPSARAAGTILVRDSQNSDTVFAAPVKQGILRSDDNGRTWLNTGQLKDVHCRDLDINNQSMWVCGLVNEGFFRSDDRGKSWQKLLKESPSEIVIDPKNSLRLYGIFDDNRIIKKSDDRGKTWQDFSAGLEIKDKKEKNPVSDSAYQALSVGPDFILTATKRGTFYKLPCGGKQWQKIGRGKPHQGDWLLSRKNAKRFDWFGACLSSITVDPKNPDRWFFTDWAAVYETTDGGKNWYLRNDGIECMVVHNLTPHPTQKNVVFAGMADVGVLKSIDSGKTFSLLTNKLGNGRFISISPANPDRIYLTGGKHWAAKYIYRSDDSGKTWTNLPKPGKSKKSCFNAIFADPNNADVVYVAVSGEVKAGQGGIYQSKNAGKTWQWFSKGLPNDKKFFPEYIWGAGSWLTVSKNGAMVVISEEKKLVYCFDPSTESWKKSTIDLGGGIPKVVEADPFNPGTFYFSANKSGLYKSVDNGVTWKKLLNKNITSVGVDPYQSGRVAVRIKEPPMVMISEDSGKTWNKLKDNVGIRGLGHPLTFSENIIISGSGGNGIFWASLGKE